MQTRKSFKKGFAFVLLIGTLVAIAAIWNATRAKAFNPQPDPPAVVFGITRDQTARLNAFNSSSPGTAPITLEFIWFDSTGNVLAQSTQSVEGGHAVSFDLDGAGLSSAFEPNRVQIVGQIRLQPPGDPDRTKVPIVASAEVFDNTGIDAGKTRMGLPDNHNETLVRDTQVTKSLRRMKRGHGGE